MIECQYKRHIMYNNNIDRPIGRSEKEKEKEEKKRNGLLNDNNRTTPPVISSFFSSLYDEQREVHMAR